MLGRVAPIEGAAFAVNDQALIATLVRRDDESVPALLQHLDDAIGKALHQGVVTNEINGGRFRLAPSRIKKKPYTVRSLSRANVADSPKPRL